MAGGVIARAPRDTFSAFVASMWTQRCFTVFVLMGLFFLMAAGAHAITAPASGSLFYDAYDIVVNSMLKGALGFISAILIFALSIGLFLMQKIVPGVSASSAPPSSSRRTP